MVGFVTGSGLGLERSSAFVLGSRGMSGSAAMGRAAENIFVNASTGNLVIQNRDEFLIGLGIDAAVARTYNSLGTMTDENGDNWRQSNHKNVSGLTGTLNTAGSTVTRTDWDGSVTVFAYDAARSAYVSKEGAGAYDTIVGTTATWTWMDGESRITESYDRTAGGRLTSSTDIDGNAITYTYTLAGIAAALYGDANLWYRLAEANGLTAASTLVEGSTLTLPAGVTKSACCATAGDVWGF